MCTSWAKFSQHAREEKEVDEDDGVHVRVCLSVGSAHVGLKCDMKPVSH